MLELIVWICTAGMGLLAITQGIGWTGWTPVFVLQATTWYALAPSIPIAVGALATGRYPLALVNAAIAVALLWLTAPIVFHDDPPAPDADDPRLSILFANTYYQNESTDDTVGVLLDADADVLAVAEYAPQMEASLRAKGAFERYPYRAGEADTTRDGMVLFSRVPFAAAAHHRIGDVPGVDATLDLDGVSVRVVVLHPLAPTHAADLRSWRRDLRTYRALLAAADRADERTIVVGDFNATRNHPGFRALLDGTGFRSAHEWLREGFSVSWPIHKLVPPFVRVDHALVRGVVPIGTTNIDTPGSDHRAFELLVAVSRPRQD